MLKLVEGSSLDLYEAAILWGSIARIAYHAIAVLAGV